MIYATQDENSRSMMSRQTLARLCNLLSRIEGILKWIPRSQDAHHLRTDRLKKPSQLFDQIRYETMNDSCSRADRSG